MERIKLLVVDDSILFRELLTRFIQQDDMIEIVGKAGEAYTAREMVFDYKPDVITVNLEMLHMDGVNFIQKILPQYYAPTIVISNSEERMEESRKAGAVEFLTKPPAARTNNDMAVFALEFCKAVRRAYKINHANSPVDIKNIPFKVDGNAFSTQRSYLDGLPTPNPNPEPEPIKFNIPTYGGSFSGKHPKIRKSDAVIALGASTGGTEALEQVVRLFPADTPPVIIVQHMPAVFTKLYAERLDRSCKMHVKEAEDGDRLSSGLIIVGAGEHHLRLCRDARGLYVSSKHGEKVSGHCPSVDVMFSSVADIAGSSAIGVILTGMGRDGADGLLKMKNAGAFTVGQDKESSVVYGMPMEAYNIGAVEVQAPLYKISEIILNMLY